MSCENDRYAKIKSLTFIRSFTTESRCFVKILQDRILKDGKVLPGNIIKVDGFLNHRVDISLLKDIADEFYRIFADKNPTLILTVEASGIALAAVTAERFGIPMLFAKKAKSDNIEGGLYKSEIYSYTYKKTVNLIVSAEWLTADPHPRHVSWGRGRPRSSLSSMNPCSLFLLAPSLAHTCSGEGLWGAPSTRDHLGAPPGC